MNFRYGVQVKREEKTAFPSATRIRGVDVRLARDVTPATFVSEREEITRPTRLSVRATYEPFGLSTPTRGNAVPRRT